ncbi:hypothetical protein HMPREF1448_01008 [Helicobacter pylori HP260AFi]|uniref:Uncharacterized protein n=1 Tax=Helicobacter pylori HP260AFii TaxID=1159077 RepID=A0ABC9S948_HELPX|nr:hypothetical protein HMPREF1416_00668 [Helicobacter pylori GAM260ASi]EMH62788.1 hypothetical protein HMPREF1448_01008 [Helicobacter pylori HP260AFi]EMH65815.1 hypothetical protein HMPREF1450_01342 [Helicobacter pylori HP260ASii]EMH66047.1 hypothetical protein HMPREF1449_01121 [Helicobacter pylori HP260AFii]
MNPLFFGGFNLFSLTSHSLFNLFHQTKFFDYILKHGSLKRLKHSYSQSLKSLILTKR